MGGYLDVKVCVFQVQRTEPVPCANLREDLLQRDHPEWPSHEGVIQASEIEDGPEAAILFGDEEVTTVKAWLAQSWRDHFYGSLYQQRHHLWAQNASVLALHRDGDHTAETRGSSSELEWITSFYYPHNPIWHSGDGLPGIGPHGKGLDKLEWPATRRQGTREGRKRKTALFENFCVLFFPLSQRMVAWALVRALYLQHTQFPLHPEKNGVKRGFLREAVWWAVRPWRDSTLSSSCPADQEDAGGTGSNAILGRGPWCFGKGWRLAEREHPHVCWVLAGWGAETAGAGFTGCWVGAVLGRLWAAAELERLGRKCRIAYDAFCASVKRSANPSTAGPKRPLGEIGASRKETYIEVVPPLDRESGFYSRYFIVPKEDGGLRPILDLCQLNCSVMRLKFRMLSSSRSCLRPSPRTGLSRSI